MNHRKYGGSFLHNLPRHALSLLIISVCCRTGTARAANASWTGLGNDGSWATAGNWSTSPVPGTGDTAIFSNAGNGYVTIDLGGGVTISRITFNPGATAYTIGAGSVGAQSLTPNSGGAITMGAGVDNDQTVNAAVTFVSGGTHSLSNASLANPLRLNGSITVTSGTLVLNKQGAGETILAADNYTKDLVDGSSSNGRITVNGGGKLSIVGGTTYNYCTANPGRSGTSYDGNVYVGKDGIGGSSSGNILDVSGNGKLWSVGLNLGGGAAGLSGSNTVYLSAPGTTGSPTFWDRQQGGETPSTTCIGNNNSYNVVYVSNGAVFNFANGGSGMGIGTADSGSGPTVANYNGMILDGYNGGQQSRFESGGSRYIQVGGGPKTVAANDTSYNFMRAINGGYIRAARMNVGQQGRGNCVTADGSGGGFMSSILLDRFCIGGNAGTGNASGNGNYNYVKITGGAQFNSSGSSVHNCIGGTGTSSYNYMQVEGPGSTMYIRFNDSPLILGGNRAGSGTVNDMPIADGNYLKVKDGGYAYNNSIYLHGTGSRVVLGEGDANIAQMEIRGDSNANWKQGIYMSKTDARLEINNGRLLAGQNGTVAPGAMVSGVGKISLLGPAFFSTAYAGSTISCPMTGPGSMTKEGAGTLIVTEDNTYDGTTTVNGGTLVLLGMSTYNGGTMVNTGKLTLVTGGGCPNSTITIADGTAMDVYVARPDGQWPAAGLNLEGANSLSFVFGFNTPTSTAPLKVSGNVGFAGSTAFNISGNAVIPVGVYPLIKYGSYSGTPTNAPASMPGGMLGVISNNTTAATIDLVVTNGYGIKWAVGTENWDTATYNWVDTASNIVTYSDGSAVLFDDTATGSPPITVTLNSPASTAGVTVDTTNTYTLTGAGSIGSGNGLTKRGSGLLVLSLANTYTGPTTVNSGTLLYGMANVIGDGSVVVDGPAAILDLGGFSDTVGAVIIRGGSITNGVLASTNGFSVNNDAAASVSAILAGSVGLSKYGAATLTLSNTNTFSGLTLITAGTLAYGVNNALATGDVTVNGSTAVLDLGGFSDSVGTVTLTSGLITGSGGSLAGSSYIANNPGPAVVSASLGGAGGLTKLLGGTLTLAGTNSYSGATAIYGGTLAYATNNAIGTNSVAVSGGILDMGTWNDTVGSVTLSAGAITGSGTLASTGGFTVNNAEAAGVTAVLAGSVGLSKSGAGTLTLSNTNTFSGLLSITAGTLAYGANNALAAGDVTINGTTAVLDLGGFSDSVGTVTLTSGSIIGSGTLTSTAGFTMNNVDPASVSARLAGGVSLAKSGTGTLALSGLNTYSGATAVSAGKLLGVAGGGCSNSAVTVAAGATNAVEVPAAGDRWTCASLTYAAGTTRVEFLFNSGVSTSAAPLQVMGNAAFNGSLNVAIISGTVIPPGIYPLIKYGSWSGSPPTVPASLPVGMIASLSNNVAGSSIDLVVTTGSGLKWAAAAGAWDIGVSPNWMDTGGAITNYLDGSAVLFDDTAPGSSLIPVALNVTVRPAGISVNNNSKAYSITGSGRITGTTGITKDGTNTLVLSGTNGFTGQLTVRRGTLAIDSINNASSDGVLGNSSAAVILGGTGAATGTLYYAGISAASTRKFTLGTAGCGNFDIAGPKVALTLSGSIDGAGSMAKTGPGTLTLSGVNSWSGDTIVEAGSLALGGNGSLGWGGGAVTVNGGILELGGKSVTKGTITVSGGAVRNGTLTCGLYDGRNGEISATLAGTASLAKTTTGTLLLSGTNTYSGVTTITEGQLAVLTAGSCANSALSISPATGNTATLGVRVTDASRHWSCAALTTAGSGTPALTFDFGVAIVPSTNTAPLAVNGNVDFATTPLVTVVGSTNLVPGMPFPLMAWTGTTNGTPPSLVTLPPHMEGFLAVSDGTLWLTVTANAQPIKWTGALGNAWDINATTNWIDGTNAPTTYLEAGMGSLVFGDAVVFDDTCAGGSPVAITLDTNVSPAFVAMNNDAKDYTISGGGSLGGTAFLLKTGSGVLSLGIAGTYSGATTLAGGTLNLNAPGAVTASAISITNAALGLNESIACAISGTASLAVNAAGAVVVLSAPNDYSGDTVLGLGILELSDAAAIASSALRLNGGTLRLRSDSPALFASTKTTVGGGATIDVDQLTTGNTGNTLSIGALDIGACTLGVTGGSGYRLSVGAVTMSGNVVLAPSTANLDVASVGGSYNLGLSGETGTNTVGLISTGTGSLTKTGAGRWTLTAANTYSGTTRIDGGTLAYGTDNAIGPGSVTVNGGVLELGTRIDSVGLVTLVAGSITGTGGTLTSTGGFIVSNATDVAVTANLAGSVGLTKYGAGRLTVTGTNTYNGTTRNAGGGGELRIASPLALQNSILDMSAGAGAVTFDGTIVTCTAAGLTGSVDLDMAGLMLRIGRNNITAAYSGVLSNGSLTKMGTGTMHLSGQNTYTGDTRIEGGTLSITNAFLSASGNVYISQTARLNTGFTTIDTIGSLHFDGVPQVQGLWGATGSGATFINDTYLSGTGRLLVTRGPPPPGTTLIVR